MEFVARTLLRLRHRQGHRADFVGCHSIGDFKHVGPTEYPSNLAPRKVTPFVGKTVGVGVPARADVVVGTPVVR